MDKDFGRLVSKVVKDRSGAQRMCDSKHIDPFDRSIFSTHAHNLLLSAMLIWWLCSSLRDLSSFRNRIEKRTGPPCGVVQTLC